MNPEKLNKEPGKKSERQEGSETIKNSVRNLKNAAAFTMALGGAMESAKAEAGPEGTVSVEVPSYSVELAPAESGEAVASLDAFATQFADHTDVIEAYLNGEDSILLDDAVDATIAGDRLSSDVAMERQVQSATLGSAEENPEYGQAVEKMESAKAAFDKLSGELLNKLDAMAAADQNPVGDESSLEDLFAEADGIIEDGDSTAEKAERPSLEGLDTNLEQNEITPETLGKKVWELKSAINAAAAKSAGEGNMDSLQASEIADQLFVAASNMYTEFDNLTRSTEAGDNERIDRYESRLKDAFNEYSNFYQELVRFDDDNIKAVLDTNQSLQPANVDSLFPSL